MNFFDVQIDFFKPLWRRVFTTVFCLAWSGVEFANGAMFWGVLFVGLGIYTFHQFFLDKWPE